MLHVQYEIHGYSGYREKVTEMDLKPESTQIVNGKTDGLKENRTPMSHSAKAGAKAGATKIV